MKLVSVIIPYYKKRAYIKETYLTIKDQSYKNLEILFIYDDTNFDDLIFLKKLTQKDKRVKIIINKKNLGAAKSRNKAIKVSKGHYIAFIDADDTWKKEKIALQLKFMIKNNALISHTSYFVMSKNKKVKVRVAKDFENYKDLLYSCDIGLSTVMAKKNLLIKNNLFANLKTKEDFVLWLKILKSNNKIYGLKKKLATWKKLDKSLSSSITQKIKDGYQVYKKYMNYNLLKSIYCLFLLSCNSLLK